MPVKKEMTMARQCMRQRARIAVLSGLVAAAGLRQIALATDYTWNGGGGDDLWGTGGNWVGGAAPFPSSTNSLIFSGSTRLTPQNNYGDGDDFFNITFDNTAGAFTIGNSGSNGIDWFGGITNNSSNTQTIGFRLYQSSSNTINASSGNVTLNSSALLYRNGQNLTLNAASGKTITIDSVIADGGGGAGSAISITGGGSVVIGGANSFTSGILIKSGTVVAGGAANNASAFGTGAINIGDSATGANAAIATSSSPFNQFPTYANTIVVNPGAGSRGIISNSTSGGQIPIFTGGITLNNTLTLQSASSGGMRFNTVMDDGAGNNGLVIDSAGSGFVRLAGANTFDGGVLIKRGSVELYNNTGLGTGAATLGESVTSNNATLFAGTSLTANNAIVINGGGTNVLRSMASGGVTFGGAITVNKSASLQANNTGALNITGTVTGGSGANTLTNSGTSPGAVTLSNTVSNGSGVLYLVQNSLTSNLNLTYRATLGVGSIAVKSGTFQFNPSVGTDANYDISCPIAIGDSSLNADAVLSLSNRSGTSTGGQISVLGSGSHTIQFNHSSSGQIHILQGAIALNSNDLVLAVTNLAGVRVSGGITGTGNVYIKNTNASGNGVDFRTTAVNNVGFVRNDSSGTGGVSQGSPVSFGANVTSLIQNSTTSNWLVNQSNANFVGTAQVLAGTMAVNVDAGLNVNNAVSVATGATLDVQNVSLTIAGLNDVSGTGGTVNQTTSTAVRTLTLGGAGNYVYSGSITAATPANLAITKSGNGIQTLSGNNSYNGATSITGGTLKIGHANALGGLTGATSVSSGATLDLNGQSINEVLSVTGAGSANLGAIINSNTSTAASVNSEITNGTGFTVGGAGDITLQRARSGGAPMVLTKIGGGNLTLGNAATTTHMNLVALDLQSASTVNLGITSGNYIVADRGLQITGGGNVRYTGTSTNMISDSSIVDLSSGTLDLNGKNDTAGKLVIGSSTAPGSVLGGAGSTYTVAATYNLFGTNTSGNTSTIEARSGLVDVNLAEASGAGIALNKTTSSSLTLNRSLSYTGTTTITAGTLIVNGTHSNAGDYVLNAGTLGGKGTINLAANRSLTVNSGGTLAPGTSAGKLSINGPVALAGGNLSTMEFEFVGTEETPVQTTDGGIKFDLLTITGNLALSNQSDQGARLNVVVHGGAGSVIYYTPYTIVTTTSGTVGGSFSKLNDQLASLQYRNSYPHYDVTVNSTSIQITFVPEPSSLALVASAMCLAHRIRRRNQLP